VKSTTSVITGIAALGIVSAAAFGVASLTPATHVKLAAVSGLSGSPLPQRPPLPADTTTSSPAPAPDLPSAEQLTTLCNQFTNPTGSYQSKANLVENGIDQRQGNAMDKILQKAQQNGNFPETFTVTDIQSTGANTASANVAVGGPKFPSPNVKTLDFTASGGNWMLQDKSALQLLEAVAAPS
jgi:hypothetical protein